MADILSLERLKCLGHRLTRWAGRDHRYRMLEELQAIEVLQAFRSLTGRAKRGHQHSRSKCLKRSQASSGRKTSTPAEWASSAWGASKPRRAGTAKRWGEPSGLRRLKRRLLPSRRWPVAPCLSE